LPETQSDRTHQPAKEQDDSELQKEVNREVKIAHGSSLTEPDISHEPLVTEIASWYALDTASA
jgi:hypothetical protein